MHNHILLYLLNGFFFLYSSLFQSVWLRHSSHIMPEHAHPRGRPDALWLRYHRQDMSRTCGGTSTPELPLKCKKRTRWTDLHFIQIIQHSVISSLLYRVFHIRPVTVFGQNGLHLSKEVAWPQQRFVVSRL